MDSSWIELPNNHPTYHDGVAKFIELAKENLLEGKTRCPCSKCKVDKWLLIEEVEQHILFKGFYKEYKNFIFHGKRDILEHLKNRGSSSQESYNEPPNLVGRDDMGGLLRAAFGVAMPFSNDQIVDNVLHEPIDEMEGHLVMQADQYSYEHNHSPNPPSNPSLDNEENSKYQRLLEAAAEALYEGCTTFSKLSFLLHLFDMKCTFHWSAESFNMLMRLLGEAFPQIMEFPSSYYEAKKMINNLGLGHEKIDACPNDCILYWGELSKEDKCHVCGVSRWKVVNGNEGGTSEGNTNGKTPEPAKVMRYFPLIPILKRIYMSPKTVEQMRWHNRDRVRDGKLRHPADARAWMEFDAMHNDFALDPRNVRLGLASDGFNPYRLMNTTYSTWPVVLIPYNLPPWLCMKPSSFILSSIIPGKSSPGNNIDVYLKPLMHELNLLWEGVHAFDAYSREYFKMRAALTWTINDFPAYAMLSGWSTKGYKACPSCTNSTHSYMFGGKICFVGCRKWLPNDHPYRAQSHLFDGTEEYGSAPVPPNGADILRQQETVDYVYGKPKNPSKKKRGRRQVGIATNGAGEDCDEGCTEQEADEEVVLWTKRSIFFELPYWKDNLLRHNLDVMHIEKNVCDNFLGTLLDMDKKSRDDENVRKAIQERGIKSHLWLQPRSGRAPFMPQAPYSMSSEEKERFLKVLQKIKVPDGYRSNLSRCVNMKQRKLLNLKSHDNHVLMQDILPVALRASHATKIVNLVSNLSSFFKCLCATALDVNELDEAQSRLILTLCEMEIHIPPTFFTIMVHLIIHLVDEAKLGGPVHYRWMYPIERYLARLKALVSNKALLEGCMAEGYILLETILFCSTFLEGVETLLNRAKRNDDYNPNVGSYLFHSGGRVIGTETSIRLDDKSLRQAHRYVLLYSDEMKDLLEEFVCQKKAHNQSLGVDCEAVQNEWIINEFDGWLRNQVHNIDASTREGRVRKALAGGLNNVATKMKSYLVNGYKFQTIERERHRKTQNSGVMVEADGQTYYGKLTGIY